MTEIKNVHKNKLKKGDLVSVCTVCGNGLCAAWEFDDIKHSDRLNTIARVVNGVDDTNEN